MIGELNTGESRVKVMVDSLNEAIDTLMKANENNRIAVVAFGGESKKARLVPVLCLNRYDEVTDGNYFSMESPAIITMNSKIPDTKLLSATSRRIRVLGGTSTQWGIYAGTEILWKQADIPMYTVNGSKVPPKPNIVLLTDGEPTFGWDDYDFSEASSPTTDGYSTGDGSHVDMGPEILTVLTASYFKQRVSERYYGAGSSKTTGFYTIGLGDIADSDDARATLNPAGVTDDGQMNAHKISQSFQGKIYNIQEVLDSFIYTGTAQFPSLQKDEASKRKLITVANTNLSNKPITTYDYADYYAEAQTAEELRRFFQDITQQIVSAGNYATSVIDDPAGMYESTHTSYADYSGSVVFSDVIGEYMEFKHFDHLLYNSKQYNGAIFAHLLAKENPGSAPFNVDINTAGPATTKLLNAMFASQLFFTRVSNDKTEDEVQDMVESLLASCLAAGDNGIAAGRTDLYGVYYNSATDFGNRIRFYAGDNGTLRGNYFNPDGSLAVVPAEATCIVDQYYMSSVTHNPVSGNPSDLIYSIFEVVTALGNGAEVMEKNFTIDSNNLPVRHPIATRKLKAGQQMVRWTIPASLLPLRSVKKAENGGLAIIETDPIRFVYSVGLRSDFSLDKVSSDYKSNNGAPAGDTYYFYTNAWRDDSGDVWDNDTLAHFVPGADNPYYTSGRNENQVPSVGNNITGTDNYAKDGMVDDSTSPVWYYPLGNNGRLEAPVTKLTVTKTWDEQLNTAIKPEYIQLYRDGQAVGEPKLANPDNGNPAVVEWTNLSLYEPEADESGNAKLVSYTILEGKWDGTEFTEYGDPTDVPFQIDYSQPQLNEVGDSLVAAVVNSLPGDQNWIVDIQKHFQVIHNGATSELTPRDIDTILKNQDKSVEFLLCVKIDVPELGEVYRVMVGDSPTNQENRPIVYPSDFLNGQRSLWFSGGDSDPNTMSFLLVELVDDTNLIDGYEYASDPVSFRDTGGVDVGLDAVKDLYLLEPDTDTDFDKDDLKPVEIATGIRAYAHEIGISSGNTAVFDITNNLVPAEPPKANLTLNKSINGLSDNSDLGHFAATFIVEGWTDKNEAEAGNLSNRIFYETVDWLAADWSAITNGKSITFSSIPPGYYTITELAPNYLQSDDGTVYDKKISHAPSSETITHNPQRHSSTVSFDVEESEGAQISLTNQYTQRPQLVIEKAFAPSTLNPIPDDIAFTVTDSTGKVVRFISYDAFDGGSYTIKDLPAGHYTVEEIGGEPIDGYYPVDVTVVSQQGSVSGSRATVELVEGVTTPVTVQFTNTYTVLPERSLTIKKNLTGYPEDWGVNSGTVFRVRIKDVTNLDSSQHKYLSFNEKHEFTGNLSVTGGTELLISENARVTVFNLEQNHKYKVEEVVPEGAAFTATLPSDIVIGSAPQTVVVENNYPHSMDIPTGSLVVSKSLLGFYGDWGVTEATEFRVRVYDEQEGNYLWFVEGSDPAQARAASAGGVYWCVGNASDGFSEAVENAKAVYTELPLTTGTSLTLQNLWVDADGWRYRVEEVIPDGEAERYTNGGVSVVTMYESSAGNNPNSHVSIRNTFEQGPGNLVITKRLAGSPADWGVGNNTPFQARVKDADTGLYLTFSANKYTGSSATGSYVIFSRSRPAVLTGIPTNKRYVVEEKTPSGSSLSYTVTYEVDGTPTGSNSEFELTGRGPAKIVTAVNIYQHATGRLIINKSLSGHYENRGVNSESIFRARVYEQVGIQKNLLYFTPVDKEQNLYRCIGSAAQISDPAFLGVEVDNVRLLDTVPFSEDGSAILDNLWRNNGSTITYWVEEVVGTQYTVQYTNNGQVLPQDVDGATGNINVTAINTYSGGGGGGGDGGGGGGDDRDDNSPRTSQNSRFDLSIKKTIAGAAADSDLQRLFHFQVVYMGASNMLYSQGPIPLATELTPNTMCVEGIGIDKDRIQPDAQGKPTILMLKHNETATIKGLFSGAYKVIELDRAGYVTTYAVGAEKEVSITSTGETQVFLLQGNTLVTITNTASSENNSNPQTDDRNNMTLWLVVLLTSVFGLAGLLAWRKQQKRRGIW
ncbi:MAG: DUF5979 domain-containing protein [Puniceicoccales bacterium]|jgi:hypothetical protein|nr:DUF5979 domain-containing protein [Puniceicoccales bacterium]